MREHPPLSPRALFPLGNVCPVGIEEILEVLFHPPPQAWLQGGAPLIRTNRRAKSSTYQLELSKHQHRLTLGAMAPCSHEGIAMAIMKSDCPLFEEDMGYTKQPSNHHGSNLPPVPPPHRQQPSITALNQSLGSTHHAGQSLNSTRQLTPPTGSPAPAAGQSPAELQTTPPESVPLQDSWVLGSNVPLETRYVVLTRQAYDDPIHRDALLQMKLANSIEISAPLTPPVLFLYLPLHILPKGRHFLFKTGTGTTPLFSTATPGYTMATGSVYSPPTRPLPRNTLSRSAFKFKKSSKYCSWRCTALSAVGLSVLLSVLLCYCIAMHLFGLNWQLQENEGYGAFENGGGGRDTTPNTFMVSTDNGKMFLLENNTIDTGEVDVGRRAIQDVPPGVFWRSQLYIDQPQFLKFNISVQKDALVGVYGRKGLPPSHTQYDFVELLDGSRLISKDKRALSDTDAGHVHPASAHEEESGGGARHTRSVNVHEAGFIQYLDTGIWHLAFYNDGRNTEQVSYNTIIIESSRLWSVLRIVMETEIVVSQEYATVSQGFLGPDCSRAACPVLCSGNGQYSRGRCQCYSGWKGTECDVPANQCIDIHCGGHGICIMGACICNTGYKGDNCEEEVCEVDCGSHGVCYGGVCRCEEGWTGTVCDQKACHPLCSKNGVCKEGKCECDQGWTGEHCNIATGDSVYTSSYYHLHDSEFVSQQQSLNAVESTGDMILTVLQPC
ncbi:hypothetical protein L3Q82_005175 [Scortum barcoo]|uniref:Uncharacterized protein n=1 Tax=Scortum barcoo TaxID=214431 RepID=A0ACB8V9J0_9TELE|nr:hypothetical protein L3Q82_005175 [Scortum barcoo]